jgi:hypothetical protein
MKPLSLLAGLAVAVFVAAAGSGTASTAPSDSPGQVVPHEKLVALFPTIPGFTRDSDPTGTTDPEMHVSRAQADYTQERGGMATLSVEIMDVSTNSMILMPFKEIQRHPGTHNTETGTQKSTTVGGFPAYEEWTPQVGNGVVGILVADRFLVTVTGSSVGKVDVIYKALQSIDLKKIAALK